VNSPATADDWEDAVAIPVGPNRLFEDGKVAVRWLPIVSSSLLRPYWLGPTSDGDWVQAIPRRLEPDSNKPLLFSDRYNPGFYYAMPLLEFSPSYVRSRVVLEAERHDLDGPATWNGLPWRGIVRSGLRSLRHQWVGPAMDWVGALGLQTEFLDELLAIAEDAHLSSAICERARRFASIP
jgi:hypothetical protein